MENYSGINEEEELMDLPPGFRFHPTDEELITHYLTQKVMNNDFNAIPIGEVDFNKVEPWDLPMKAKMGEKEWYFFCVKDRKYPTGLRTNRATESGYWKATGKDKEIHRAKSLVGMKKTLVFYSGRAPKGEKTNWVMHEYRLEGKYSKLNPTNVATNEWVLSRVFEKSYGGTKPDIPGFVSLGELNPPLLPPLVDYPSYNNETKTPMMGNSSHVPCFSHHPRVVEDLKIAATTTTATTQEDHHIGMIDTTNHQQNMYGFQYTDSIFMEDESILRLLLEGKSSNMTSNSKADLSHESGLSVGDMNTDQMGQYPVGPIDLGCLWDY